MKFVQFPMGAQDKTLVEVRKGLIEEFIKPKSEAQYITEFNEIKQYPNEIVWDFDQRFKTLMARVSFEMSDIQHKEWFITALLTYIRLPYASEYRDTERGSGDIHEVGSFTYWRKCSWYEPNSDAVGELNTTIARY